MKRQNVLFVLKMLAKRTRHLLIRSLYALLACGAVVFAGDNGVPSVTPYIMNTVDHKNTHLNSYLDLIRFNAHEKNEILSYILKNQDGLYLEVGTGGDPIAELLSKIPADLSPTIIACDVDARILEALPERHPDLLKYMKSEVGPKLVLQQLDGTNMNCFADQCLSGINASAVVHEIISYAGGLHGFRSFFSESFRVLKKDGVLIYRDPEGVADKHEIVSVSLADKSIKLFTHIFIPKFLDSKYGKLTKSGNKYQEYGTDQVVISCYRKNQSGCLKLSYDGYLAIPSSEIDFSREFIILMPRGLAREIERHYLTYLHQCNPLLFIKCIPTLDSSGFSINFLAQSTSGIFEDFIKTNNIDFSFNVLDNLGKKILEKTIETNCRIIEEGLKIHFNSADRLKALKSLIRSHGFNVGLYLQHLVDNDYVLDYRMYGLLYDYINDTIFDADNKPVVQSDTIHAQYLKREGEETYIYYSDDELITQAAEISFYQPENEGNLIFCPISPDHNFFVPRLCYKEVLQGSLAIKDLFGYDVEIQEGKRIVHFMKMPVDQARAIFVNIINTNPCRYKKLAQFVDKKLNFIEKEKAVYACC